MQREQPNIPEKFLKPYNPQETEPTICKKWEESGFFNPDSLPLRHQKGEPFSIVLPPPNVTGTLHIGHALMLVVEDIMVRFERMRGKKTLWLPGTDHAAIATQSRVEKDLEKKGIKKLDLGREAFLKEVEAFAQNSHDTIKNQIIKMGASVDWSREAYTLDEKRNLAVRTAFKKMYEDGLIYRKERIVNWDPKGQTTISDDELVYEERKAKLYTFKYSKDFPISIATTRPETKIGDTGVAVHPNDARYKAYIGKIYECDFAGEKISIKIVSDSAVDPAFGTGAVGVTPAHSVIDSEIAARHNLPMKQIIDEKARIISSDARLSGKKVAEAREIIVSWLKENNLLEKEEDIIQNISTAERTGGIIEPLPKLQWWINVNKKLKIPHSNIEGIEVGKEYSLKELMIASVRNGQIKIIPERFEKIYFHWVENLRDWCISRQIWFGHRIPVWYKDGEISCGIEAPKGDGWTQDPDTLDTWFSSGLWTFSTLGWPNLDAKDLKIFHPTTVLETGYDILFFWVARMILMSSYLLGEIPFKTVYLHGLVRDGQGRKMSKSLGNVIDPLDASLKFGTDAVRLSLVIGTSPGNDSKMSEDKIRAYKNFANKIWNATRFVLEATTDFNLTVAPQINEKDKTLLSELDAILADVTKDMENYRYYLAGEKLYHYFWHTFADLIIEESKPIINGSDKALKVSRQRTILTILKNCLRALHPFVPFVTEEIWDSLPENHTLLIVEEWPTEKNSL